MESPFFGWFVFSFSLTRNLVCRFTVNVDCILIKCLFVRTIVWYSFELYFVINYFSSFKLPALIPMTETSDLNYRENQNGPSTDPWGTPVINECINICIQQNIYLIITDNI